MKLEMFQGEALKILDSQVESLTVQVGAIAGNANNATNLNYVIIGLVVVIIVLIVITLLGNKR